MTDNQTSDSRDTNSKNGRRKWFLIGLATIFVIAGLGYAIYYFMIAQFYASTSDAYVHGNRIQLAPQIDGTVVRITADNTDRVKAGQTLIVLDASDERAALDSAEANLANAVRSVRQLFAQVAEQQSIIVQRRSALDQARRDYERDRKLVAAHGVPKQLFERARAAYTQARASLAAAQHRLTELQAQTSDTTLREHPRVKQAESRVETAYLNLQRTRIPAPINGYVAQRDVQVGQRATPSRPMLSIVPLHRIWVEANFKETALAAMRIGQSASVVSDFYGDAVRYHGHVAGISAGTGSAFELLPPQNATGNWIKIVQRVPVRIALDNRHHQLEKYPLRMGLSMTVTVDLHDISGPRLATRIRHQPLYDTNVYEQRLEGARKLIARIIEDNAGSAAGAAQSSFAS